jgi:hypothetical protein
LTSTAKWTTFFNGKLPNSEKENQATRSLVVIAHAAIVELLPFATLRPQYVQSPVQDVAMMEPADDSDHILVLAISVKIATYIRTRLCRHPYNLIHRWQRLLFQQLRFQQQHSIFRHINARQRCTGKVSDQKSLSFYVGLTP